MLQYINNTSYHSPKTSRYEILSIDETFGQIGAIVFRNKNEGQVVKVLTMESNKIHQNSLLKGLKTPFINLIRLYVHPDYRKLGWGTLIMNRLIENSKNKTIIVDAFPDNESYMTKDELINFYMKFGFKILKPSEQGIFLIRK
jgi:GNAT superfamily N-acetyltransferase